jgi:hypothetical protein
MQRFTSDEHPIFQALQRRGHARTTGLIVAAGIALLCIGVVGWFIVRAPEQSSTPQAEPAIPDLPVTANQPGAKRGSQLDAMGSNSGPFMQFADRRDPTRVAGEITAERAEPLEGRRYRLDSPRAWSFLRDGRTLYIEANTARASFAESGAKGRPEEATLEGDVTIRLFGRKSDASRPDPARDEALFIARTEELRYDGTLGRLVIPAEMNIRGERINFSGTDITLLFNEADERIDSLKITKTDKIEFIPSPPSTRKNADASANVDGSSLNHATPAANAALGSESKTVEYAFSAGGEVSISQGTRRVTGDVLSGRFRTIDNRLPDRVFQTSSVRPAPSRISTRNIALPGIAMLPGVVLAADSRVEPAPQLVKISFTGAFELVPLSTPSAELEGEDAHVRVSANAGGFVVATDEDTRATVKAVAIEYGAVRQRIALFGDESRALVVNVPGQGILHAQDVRVDARAGVAKISGAGRLERATGEGAQDIAAIAWTDEVTLDFIPAVTESDVKIKRAEFIGAVLANDTSGSFGADRVIADFDPQATNTGFNGARLIGAAKASNSDGDSLSADRIDVRFAQGKSAGEIAPRRLDAQGSVVGVRKNETFRAGSLVADLMTDDQGETVVAHAEANAGIEYSNSDGMQAVAPRMIADPVAGFVELSGEGARVSKDSTRMSGSRIRLFADERRVEVPGAGEFAHTEPGKNGAPPSNATISWTGSMTFNDGLGRAECVGGTRAVLMKGDIERSTLDADRVTVLLESTQQTPGEATDIRSSRKVTRVEALGGDSPVKVETRRYEAGKPEELAQLLYLESAKVIALGVEGMIEVPQEGKLLAVDRRPSNSQAVKGSLESSGRGDALFRWKKSLLLDRAKGELRMTGDVQLDHRTLADGSRVRLECDALTAFTESMTQVADDSGVGQLRKVVATGKVWMRGMGRELTAAEVAYDAARALVTAAGGANSKVNVVDTKTGSPFAARWLNWELNSGRVEALSADPMIVPR